MSKTLLIIVFLVLLFPLLPLPLASTQTTYYVRPTSESPCHHEDCHTLSEYASETNRYFNSDNLTLVFLPGEHTLNTSIDFQLIESLTLLGDLSFLPNITSKIVCSNEMSAFSLISISVVEIKALAFYSCGSSHESDAISQSLSGSVKVTENVAPAISALFIPNFHLVSCHMEHNYLPLYLNNSRMYSTDNQFVHNKGSLGGAIAAYSSTVLFLGQNLFLGNNAVVGGAVYAERSELVFRGLSTFIDNTAKYGGGIGANNSTFLYGDPSNKSSLCNYASAIFIQNLAESRGGGIWLISSVMQQSGGNLNFTLNQAADKGGGIFSDSSLIHLDGYVVLERNSAKVGGAVSVQFTTWDSTVVTFVGNSVNYDGGAVYSFHSDLNFGTLVHTSTQIGECQQEFVQCPFMDSCYQITFRNNSARWSGGALYVNGNTVVFNGNSVFEHNVAHNPGAGLYVESESIILFKRPTTFINNSVGGIRIFDSQLHFEEHTTFTGNYAITGGGIDATNSALTLSGEIGFVSNKALLNGGVVSLQNSTLILRGTGSYVSNTAGGPGGVISAVEGSNVVLDGQNTITWNSAAYRGGAISVIDSTLTITGISDFLENWASYSGGALYAETSNLILGGLNSFVSNVATSAHGYGGAIHVVTTLITLSGIHDLTNNSAIYGGGLAITSYGTENFLYLTPNSSVSFLRNYAQKHGGAIFVEDTQDHYCGPDVRTLSKHCFIALNLNDFSDPQWLDHCNETDKYMNPCLCPFLLEGNFAEDGGNTIYGGNLHNCIVELSRTLSCRYEDHWSVVCYMSGLEAVAALTQTSVEQLTRDPLNVASYTYKVCTCDSHKPNCKQRTINHTAYPVETVFLPLVAVGEDEIVPAAINAEVSASEGVWLGQLQDTQAANLSCTFLGYTLLTSGTRPAKLILSTEGPCENPGIPLYVHVNFLPCPFGFALSQFGSCGCERRLQKYTNSCDINSITFTRYSDFWLGFDHNSQGLILHPHCPYDYCKIETVSFTLNSTDLQCAHSKTGTLCGACKSGLSLNLGSSQCSPCSNVFLLLFLPFAIAGFLIVVFLFTCQVTVAAGTTSGLIFYANVLAVNRNVFFPSGETNTLTVFISWLNLDLGIETCLRNGLDMYTRTWLKLVFPLYIWILVGIVGLTSYYSMTVARIIGPTNPVSVLATLFLLSYTKLLRTIIATFSFTTLDYPNDRSVTVWVYDGNIGYFEGKHIPLFLAGLLAFLLLFLPYTLLLLFGQCIEAGSNHKLLSWANNLKVRSFLDAYHAPYKNRHRYWTGLLLMLRFGLFIVSAVIDINSPRDPSINFLVLGTTSIGLMVWVWNTGNMYKKWYNNVLESSFLFNLAILVLASYQVKVEGGNQAAVVYTSVTIAFVTFLGIITYHVTERVKDSRMWRNHIGPKLQRTKNSLALRQQCQDPIEMAIPPTARPPPVTTTFVDLRESLLESQH